MPRLLARTAGLLRRTGAAIVERPRRAIWATIAIAAAMLAVGLAHLTATNTERWTNGWKSGATMVVYLGAAVDEAHGRELTQTLAHMGGVEHAEYVPATESTRRLRVALAGADDLLDGVDPTTMPASVELVLEPGMRDVVAMSPTIRALERSPGVEGMELTGEWVDKVGAALVSVRYLAWGLGAMFSILALVIVLATARLRLATSRRHGEVARLLGARPGYLAVPTALAGAVQGAVGAALGAGALWLLHDRFAGVVASKVSSALGQVDVAYLAPVQLALLVAIGAGLGLLGGAMAGMARAER